MVLAARSCSFFARTRTRAAAGNTHMVLVVGRMVLAVGHRHIVLAVGDTHMVLAVGDTHMVLAVGRTRAWF